MQACFIGLGYIGLPTAIIAAGHGIDVTGVDINPDVVRKTNAGQLHIIEPGLQELLQSLLQKQKVWIDRVFSYAQAGEAARVRKYGQVLEESYEEDGIHIKAYVPKALAGEFQTARK